ncbi:MAG: RES family NAD+ phosphorylase [Burkholderiaceae bacterium]
MRIVAEFNTVQLSLEVWRAVEAQHRVSTMVLVDTLDEQALLEQLLEESKPALQGHHQSLHWLLFTPFRYPPLPNGSRFRGPADPGVFYGADARRTACAELGYWRWRLLMDSPELDHIEPLPQTLFQTPVHGRTIDLREPPFSDQPDRWLDPDDYSACQALARRAREEEVEIIRYRSVRDPEGGACAALLTHRAFAAKKPSHSETWMLSVSKQFVSWRLDSIFETGSFEFRAEIWAAGGKN